MALRIFQDGEGMIWRVWDVVPHYSRGSAERLLSSEMGHGWLCFESRDGRKKRLVPIPDGWAEVDDAALDDLRRRAEEVETLL